MPTRAGRDRGGEGSPPLDVADLAGRAPDAEADVRGAEAEQQTDQLGRQRGKHGDEPESDRTAEHGDDDPEHICGSELHGGSLGQLVSVLSAQVMSTRAIAPTVGVDQKTVYRDQVRHDASPDEPERIDPRTGEVLPMTPTTELEAPLPEVRSTAGAATPTAPRSVVGLDGKTYSRPEPKPQTDRRPPLRDGFRDAALDLGKIVTRFERLIADDRLARNKSEVARVAHGQQELDDPRQMGGTGASHHPVRVLQMGGTCTKRPGMRQDWMETGDGQRT